MSNVRAAIVAEIARTITAVERPHPVRVATDFPVSLARAERRDRELFGSIEEVRRRYEERYIPGQRLYLSTQQPERFASLVVDNNDPSKPRVVAREEAVR